MTDQVSHPYKIRGNIIILCILIFMFLIQNGKTRAFWTEGSQAFPDFNALELLQGRAFDLSGSYIRHHITRQATYA